MKTKLISLLLAAATALATLAGCTAAPGTASSVPPSSQETSSQEVSSEAASVTSDREGTPITLPEKVERIISTAPSNTEILVGLGAADKLVMVDKYSAGVEGLPTDILQADFRQPDAEALIQAKPDVLIASSHNREGTDDPYALLKEAGICVIYVPTSVSIEGICGDIEFLGAITGTADKAKQMADEYQSAVNEIKANAALRSSEPPKVFFEISSDPSLYSFGKGTFLNEFIEVSGGVNILGEQEGWISPDPEAVIAANPDVIITSESYDPDIVEKIKSRDGWGAVNAVANNRVYVVDTNEASRASQNSIKALRAIAQALNPKNAE